jgi:hypothetical protein
MTESEKTAIRIARQSQMERAIEYFQLVDKKPSVEDVVLTSHILHKYIMDGWSGDMSEMLKKLDVHLNKHN